MKKCKLQVAVVRRLMGLRRRTATFCIVPDALRHHRFQHFTIGWWRSEFMVDGRYQQFIRKNIDVSRRDEMLHRQKVFWVLVLPNQIWTWAIKSSNQVKHQVRLHVVVATASQQPTKKHKQCSRVSVETSTTSTNLEKSNPGWSFDQQSWKTTWIRKLAEISI